MLNFDTYKQKNIGIALPFAIGCTQSASGIISNFHFVF